MGLGQVDVSSLLLDPNQDTKLTIQAKPIVETGGSQANGSQVVNANASSTPAATPEGSVQPKFIDTIKNVAGDVAGKVKRGAAEFSEFVNTPAGASTLGQLAAALDPNTAAGRVGAAASQIAKGQQFQALTKKLEAGEEPDEIDLFGMSPNEIAQAKQFVTSQKQATQEMKFTDVKIKDLEGLRQFQKDMQTEVLDTRKSIAEKERLLREKLSNASLGLRRELAGKSIRIIDQGDKLTAVAQDALSGDAYPIMSFDKGESPDAKARNKAMLDAKKLNNKGSKITARDLDFQSNAVQASSVFKELMDQVNTTDNKIKNFFGVGGTDPDVLQGKLAEQLLSGGLTQHEYMKLTGKGEEDITQAEKNTLADINEMAVTRARFGLQGTGGAQIDEHGYAIGQRKLMFNQILNESLTHEYKGDGKWVPVR